MAVDLAVILLPEIGMQEAALMLRRHAIPFRVASRVLTALRRRRCANSPKLPAVQ